MRRWNGWGSEAVRVQLPEPARAALARWIGPGVVTPDAELAAVIGELPSSRLTHVTGSTSPRDRLLYARGQSLPDWIALRSGRVGRVPDAVARPRSEAEVDELLAWARREQVTVIPYGGGTSVLGHLDPGPGERPVLTLSLEQLTEVAAIDEDSQLAQVHAGARGPALEAQLAARGYQLGHYPQSFEYSTVGGWIATRSSGQQSFGFGRIEDLFAGGRVATLAGPLVLPPLPASAAGPDLRHWVLGSEGRLGIITHAWLRVRRPAEHESFHAVLLPDFEAGLRVVRELAREGLCLSMLRLSDADETRVSWVQAGAPAVADRALGGLGFRDDARCLLVFAVTGKPARARSAALAVYARAARSGGLPLGRTWGEAWKRHRFAGPYLRNALWEQGYAADTLETAAPWSRLPALWRAVKASLRAALGSDGVQPLVYAHVSHVYPDGASLYFTYVFPRLADPDALLERWRLAKGAANAEIVEHGATISHHHGVGRDHAGSLEPEKSPVGMAWLRAALEAADPEGLLNPGKLLPDQGTPRALS